ncbi:MAG: proteasome-associated ATPase [Actinomycetota bacterium]|nr:proteasome-associated ATPase [Actinomycetota bacterium]
MKVWIDQDLCTGDGLCEEIAPAVFTLLDDGLAYVKEGDKEILFFKDFTSGAMIENIVRRAKKLSIKRTIAGGTRGIGTQDLLDSIKQEFREHEDLPNTTNPDDWAKISGKKGERIVYVRTIMAKDDEARGGRQIERITTGQYL